MKKSSPWLSLYWHINKLILNRKDFSVLFTQPRQRVKGFLSLLYRLTGIRTRLNPVSPPASRSLLGLPLSKREKQHCILPAQTCTSLQTHPEALWLFLWVIWIKHCKMSCICPSFGRNYSSNSVRMWNSEQPQWSSTFWQSDLYEKQYPFLCTTVLSAKPHAESELKVPYARRNNTIHHLPCT